MTFKKLLTMAAAIMMAGSLWAQGWTPSAVAEGDYYLYNVGAKGFVVGANNWGTRVSIADKGGIKVTLVETSGAYEIKTSPTYNGKHLGFNGYVDNGDADQNWIFEAVEGETNVYKLSTGSAYLFADEGATTTTVGADPGTNYAYWILVSVTDYVKDLAAATDENPMDATCLFLNPNFSRDASQSAWTMDAGNKNLSGGTNENRCAESWQSAFTLTQTVELPNGYYKVRAQAALTDYTGAYDGADYPVVYANDATVPFFSMEEADRGTNMNTLSNSFTAGNYFTEWIEVTVLDKKLSVGVKGTRTNTWCIWDNFQILYCGPLDLSAYATAMSDALTAAKAVDQSAPMNATVLADLQAAIATYEGAIYDNSDDYEAAVDVLVSATDAAKASIDVYATIKGYSDKVAALKGDAAAAAYADVLAAYNAATATEAETAAAAYLAALKVAEPEAVITDLASASWVGQTGNVAAWACPDAPGSPERYQAGAFTGDVMTQTITGLQNGTYKVKMIGGASYTSGRGFEGATGQNHAYFFANDALKSLEVFDRGSIDAGKIETAELTCGVKDGTLKFGIQNITIGANWFVIRLESITFVSTDLPKTDVTLAVGEAKYATFIAPFEYEVPAGVKAYTVDAVDADAATLVMTEKTTVPANTPVVLYAESPVSTTVSGVSEAASQNYTVGLLTGVYGETEITAGYVLQNQAEDGVKFYAVSAENPKTVPANHAYLTVPAGSEVKAFGFDAIATAIQNIEVAKAAQNGAIFNLAGQQLNGLQKGINIVNGKKVLVK